MISTPLLGSFGNLIGLDGVLIFGVQIAFIIGLILLIRFLVRRGAPDQLGSTPEARLQKLDSMRSSGVITEAEYQEQRRHIVSQV